jgi:predicted nucleic acid-binding protein
MVILDTNVLSEALKAAPDERVMAWLKEQSRPSLFTTTVTRGEILYGIRLLPDGKRRRALWDAALAIFNEDFAERVLGFDSDAADAYAEIGASRRAAGRPISQFDAMIAGMARSRGAGIATRNAKDFEACGVDVVDPWSV